MSVDGDARENTAEAAFPRLLKLLLPRSAYRYSPLIVMLLVTAIQHRHRSPNRRGWSWDCRSTKSRSYCRGG